MFDSTFTSQQVLEMHKRPYHRQIAVTQSKILETFIKSEGNFYIAFSGGKDSCVLLYLVAQQLSLQESLKTNVINVVCNDTTNEMISVFKHVPKFCKFIENKFGVTIKLHITRPKNNNTFVKVVKTVGIPFVSKTVARQIEIGQEAIHQGFITYEEILSHLKPTVENVEILSFKLNNYTAKHSLIAMLLGWCNTRKRFNEHTRFKLAKRWLPLLNYPQKISNKCCGILKHNNVPKELKGYAVITGELAQDSTIRFNAFKQTGCVYKQTNGVIKAKPLGGMTLNSLLRYIKENNIPVPSVYGEVTVADDLYKFSKAQRTGCSMCCFGINYNPDRFTNAPEEEQARIRFMFKPLSEGGLGYKELFEYSNKHCGTKLQIPGEGKQHKRAKNKLI